MTKKSKIDSPSLAGGGAKAPKQDGFRSGVNPNDQPQSVFAKAYNCAYCPKRATKAVVWGSFSAFTPTCEDHIENARDKIEKSMADDVDGVRDLPVLKTEVVTKADTEGVVLVPPHEQLRKSEGVPEFREKAELAPEDEGDE